MKTVKNQTDKKISIKTGVFIFYVIFIIPYIE